MTHWHQYHIGIKEKKIFRLPGISKPLSEEVIGRNFLSLGFLYHLLKRVVLVPGRENNRTSLNVVHIDPVTILVETD